jgi:hypothetical protein
MSKQTLRKFKKNDYSFDDEEDLIENKNKIDKRKQRRFERALKTKDISALIESEEFVDDWD